MTVTIAIPSKGRLKEQTIERFAAAGLTVSLPDDSRNYRGSMDGFPQVEIAFLSASEIARELIAGNVHLGVTGEDLAREAHHDADAVLEIAAPLGFGHADVVVAIPDAWVDVVSMADLDDVAAGFRQTHGRRLRIATKYWQLTQHFFAGHGIAVYRIVESLGATEGAPASGQADVIVDITSTGSTLKANRLRILEDGVILRSQAHLIRSRTAEADETSTALIGEILTRICGAS